MKIIRNIFWIAVSLVLCFAIYANFIIIQYNQGIYSSAENIQEMPVALVFGGGMMDNGDQTPMQYDRVEAGVELYKQGKVQKVMMTGDDGRRVASEVQAMKEQAIARGVPEGDIIVDPAGLRTYESCYRAKEIYGITHAIGVSQNFHLPRIIYFCYRQGINIIGYSADKRNYDYQMKMEVREVLARVKGWWQQEITKPDPQYLGEKQSVL